MSVCLSAYLPVCIYVYINLSICLDSISISIYMGFSMIINGEYPLDAVESPSPAPPPFRAMVKSRCEAANSSGLLPWWSRAST
jgi:hypothetical protein